MKMRDLIKIVEGVESMHDEALDAPKHRLKLALAEVRKCAAINF